MDNPEEIWNLLHDGGIAAVRGTVPGDLTLRVEIAYLTQAMSPPCDAIDLTLVNCGSFEYLNWTDDRRTTDINVLAEVEPEILSAENIQWDASWGTDFAIAGEDPITAWRTEKELYERADE